ncbi:hypothetical protein PpBr36_02950 [Pyricularia pennisetigena]|uniref:hypothetical protein n=1 Tax=Pyricularia pennisetigena TaxID=1578925 RepID=UPI001153F934|nr:hypothetical protein PpBr36_02950 [Pyricularia pennisetigena]TLS31219.1 hypothetical protein PpBr36_02950 [Pyricularia pennisetigena]
MKNFTILAVFAMVSAAAAKPVDPIIDHDGSSGPISHHGLARTRQGKFSGSGTEKPSGGSYVERRSPGSFFSSLKGTPKAASQPAKQAPLPKKMPEDIDTRDPDAFMKWCVPECKSHVTAVVSLEVVINEETSRRIDNECQTKCRNKLAEFALSAGDATNAATEKALLEQADRQRHA